MAQTYREYRPTGFDAAGLALPERQDWLVVPVSRNRDSGLLENHNFDAALRLLGGEDAIVEVHRFGHWACGWYEIILADPCMAPEIEEIENTLSEYPILDEDTYNMVCWDAASDTWDSSTLRERIAYCVDAGVSIFAARREYDMPERCYESIIKGME